VSEISLKQIISFRSCPRQWAAKFLFRLPDPKHPNAQLGIDVHAAAEAYLKTGRFDFVRWNRDKQVEERVQVSPESHLGKLAKACVAFAPPGALPELVQAFDLFGRTVNARVDCVWPDWSEFADWKSSSGYGELSPKTLPTDVQANWQSHGVMVGSGRQEIAGLWVYADKKTYKARPVQGTFRLAETEAFLRREVLPAMQMIELFRELHDSGRFHRLDQMPHDMTACDGRGKFCSFLGHCQLKPSTGATLAQLRAHK
jgi:hypothetical protein